MTNSLIRPLTTNGFEIQLPEAIDVVIRDFPSSKDVKDERERLGNNWFVHWFGGKLYHLRLKGGGPNVEGDPTTLRVTEHPWLFRARVEDAIGVALPDYKALRERPFTFLAKKSELIQQAASAANIRHPLLDQVTVTPRFSLNTKIYELSDGQVKLGLFVTVGMRHEINAKLSDLQDAGIDLRGLHVVKREVAAGERRHVGRIKRLEGETVLLYEAYESENIKIDELKLEGSNENFSICLKNLLEGRYKAFEDALDDAEAKYRTGPNFDKVVTKMGQYLSKTPIEVAQRVHAKIGKRILIGNNGEGKNVYVAPPVDYVFDRTGANCAKYAWAGLSKFGPYDRTSFPIKSPRVLVVFPSSARGKTEGFLAALRDGMGANYQSFPTGFTALFGLVNLEFLMCPVEISGSDGGLAQELYREAIRKSLETGQQVDAGIIILLDEHAFLSGLQNPYIRSKALLLTLGIPTQVVRMNTLNQHRFSLQYSLQNLSISLYAKMTGTPWTVHQSPTISDELVVGVGFAELSGSRVDERQRYAGITTVFSGDGTYLLGNVSRECTYAGYADMLRESMLDILGSVKERNNWQPGDTVRIIYHAHRPLRRVDIARIVFDCTREIGAEQELQMAFVTVSHEHPFYILDPAEKGVPVKKNSTLMKGVAVPQRGTIARMGPSTRLLEVNSGRLIKRANSPLPRPLLIHLHKDSTFKDVDYLTEQVLKFTSMSWRSTLPAGTPVTIFYSERIAELLGRLREVPDWSATALSVKLRWSRWFL